MKFRIAERWKRAFRLALVTILLVLIFFVNKYEFAIGFNFLFQSKPIVKETPAPEALEIKSLEDSTLHEMQFRQTRN